MIAWIEADGRREKAFLEEIRRRGGQTRQDALEAVQDILRQVRLRGDAAARELTLRYDRADLEDFRVSGREWDEGIRQVPADLAKALAQAAENIRAFHERQKRVSWHMTGPEGIFLGLEIRPLKRVGIYVPGGTAAYFSSVLMNAIPAQAAGVEEIYMVTPPSPSGGLAPATLAAARLAGVRQIYKIGGAQAVAALAYGTETVPKVDKITGPGNLYVSLAKRLVAGETDIDKIAGPSEILIIAEGETRAGAEGEGGVRTRAGFIAADLLSQAEHDPMASAILLTPSRALALEAKAELERRLEVLPRKETARQSLKDYGGIIVTRHMDEAAELADAFAPEHLELLMDEPLAWAGRIRNAGAIFMGDFSPEPLGDYFAGPNHILPTGGTARFASPLSVDDFLKKTSLVYYSEKALKSVGDQIMVMARSEGFQAHAGAVQARLDGGDSNQRG
ncbi:MAG: histidinol dehydrogenase [Peptococcaceae bacterium]|jgi:histidinol dehydrogenase|nr:histidinol dehydrogenase [Peptococcaceae bacterium]